uniref:Uncharacterized protein n=1 Tax=Anopheles dirus TaxID=7168 RepID=A0A182NDC6_9DIPT
MGVSFFKREHNFKNFLFLFGISNLFLYMPSVIISAYQNIYDVIKLMYCVATFGFGCQATMKIYTYIVTRKRVIYLYEKNMKYYKDMLDQSEKVRHVLCENANLTYVVIKFAIILYIFLVFITLSMPLLLSLYFSERILPFGFTIPFTSDETTAGYIGNYLCQLVMSIYYGLITVASDITTIFNLLTANGQLNVLVTIVEELDELLDRDESPQVIKNKIKDIIRQHQSHRIYFDELINFLNPYHFVTLGSTVPTMIVSVVGLVLLNWYPGAIIMFFASIQIFFICFLGTSLELKTDALTETVSAIHWDKLSVQDMKSMNLVQVLTQHPKILVLATLPLNIAAYLQIHKFIYSMIMMMENTKE